MSDLVSARARATARAWWGADDDERLARAAWSVLGEPGDGVAGALRAAYGAAGALERVADPAPDAARAVREGVLRWRPRWDPARVEAAVAIGARRGLALVIPGDPAWPEGLADLGAHAPACLWVRGDPAALARPRSAALVGARAATAYGEHVTAEIAGDLARSGVTVVSGAAYGIDGAAHRAALQGEGPTIAYVAGGADRVYPAGHAALLEQIARAGAVAAECPPGTTPTRWRFLARNRLIAAHAAATVIVEAGARSGSINTAGHAAALGRPLGAVPGPVTSSTSSGCHRLLREYAAVCITRAADVRELLGEADPAPPVATDPPPEVVRVADALTRRRAQGVGEIAARSGLAPDEVESALGLLVLEGAARRTAEGWLEA
ncbi:DNA-processing protein DprA [Microbacterium sp. ZXX196]|uniref:DNA-processing protein DprA n=1 Tax=Microbacterium sp. ZXX196 TaxID=2609291 RepID=UPI0034D35021